MNAGKTALMPRTEPNLLKNGCWLLNTSQLSKDVIGTAKIPNNIAPTPTKDPVPLVASTITTIKSNCKSAGRKIPVTLFINCCGLFPLIKALQHIKSFFLFTFFGIQTFPIKISLYFCQLTTRRTEVSQYPGR